MNIWQAFSTVLVSAILAGSTGTQAKDVAGSGAANQSALHDKSNVVVMVETEDAAKRLVINASRGDYQLNSKQVLASLNLIILDFERPRGISDRLAVADMKRMEPGAVVGLDDLYRVQSKQQNQSRGRHYADQLIEWPADGCLAHISIGMIDDGIDLRAKSLESADITARNFTDGPEARAHGTSVASLLVGKGRLKDARLYSANVVGQGDRGAGLVELVSALNWMQAMEVRLVNISLAGPKNPILEKAIRRTSKAGIVIVAAAGNDGPSAAPLYPAAFEEVISVTAVDSAYEIYDKAVQGTHIDFAAPGVDVFVSEKGYLTGTSIAAPFVTALIAGDKNLSKLTSSASVRRQASQGALDLGTPGHDQVYGAGLIQQSQTCEVNS